MNIKALTLFFFIIAFGLSDDSQILVKVKDRIITKNDFIKRSEFTIRPNYCRSDNNIHKKIILNSLVAEKLMAIEIEPFVDESNFSSDFLSGIKEQKMREVYLNNEVYSEIQIDSLLINEHFYNSTKTYGFNFVSFSNDTIAANFNYYLSNGRSFEEVSYDYLNVENIPYRQVDYNSENDPNVFFEIFSQKLKSNDILGPVISKDKKILFLKVVDIKDAPLITPKEKQNQFDMVYQRLLELKQIEAYDKFVLNLMSGSRLKFHEKPFFKLAEKAYNFYILKNGVDKLEKQAFSLLDYMDELQLKKEETFLNYNEKSLSIEDVDRLISKHPLLFRKEDISAEEFPLQFKYSIVDLIRDEEINQIAYLNNYDKHIEVISEYNLFKDATLSTLHSRAILDRNNISSSEFDDNHIEILKDVFDPYIDSLKIKYSDQIQIDFDVFKDIKLTQIDLYAYKKGVPYPMLVPLFPIITKKHAIDYGSPFNF